MGLVIQFIIKSNNPWLVMALAVVMLCAAVQITLARAHGIPKGLALPVFLTLAVTMLFMVALVGELIIRPKPWYAPQLLLPLIGMMLGNCVSAIAVAMSRFYESMEERRDEIGTMLALGASPWECSRTSIVSSMRLGLLPTRGLVGFLGHRHDSRHDGRPGHRGRRSIGGREVPVRGVRGDRRTDAIGGCDHHDQNLPHLFH
jgi:putative ABC transport system permease protein